MYHDLSVHKHYVRSESQNASLSPPNHNTFAWTISTSALHLQIKATIQHVEKALNFLNAKETSVCQSCELQLIVMHSSASFFNQRYSTVEYTVC